MKKKEVPLIVSGIKDPKILAVLIALGRNTGKMTVPDLQQRLGYKENVMRKIIISLERKELIEQNPGKSNKLFDDRKYKLTMGSVIILERLQNKFPQLLSNQFNFI